MCATVSARTSSGALEPVPEAPAPQHRRENILWLDESRGSLAGTTGELNKFLIGFFSLGVSSIGAPTADSVS
jgi:hypothetical protein